MRRPPSDPLRAVQIVETSVFTRRVAEMLTDDEYRALQAALLLNPEMGP